MRHIFLITILTCSFYAIAHAETWDEGFQRTQQEKRQMKCDGLAARVKSGMRIARQYWNRKGLHGGVAEMAVKKTRPCGTDWAYVRFKDGRVCMFYSYVVVIPEDPCK
jgi:hypothetical protein